MKNRAKAFLQFVLVLALLLSAGAQTASAADAEDYAAFRIGSCISGSQYAFFITAHGASVSRLTGDGLYHIDQLEASGSELLIAVILPGITSFDAYAGGVFSDGTASPRKLGSYTAYRMPEQLEKITDSAFEATGFTHVILGDKVKSIGSKAFANCEKLAYIFIPQSVKTIAADAFSGSSKIVIGCLSGSAAETFARQYGIPFRTLD